MALKPHALIDLANFKEYLKIPVTETSQDGLLESFINAASKRAEVHCNRLFRQQTVEEIYNGNRTNELLLYNWPVSSILRLNIDPSKQFSLAGDLSPTEYYLESDQLGDYYNLVLKNKVFPSGTGVVFVQYMLGYATFDDVPDDLMEAVRIAAAYYYTRQQNEDFTETNKSKGDENVSIIDGLPRASKEILKDYKRLEVPGSDVPIRKR